MRFKFEYRNTKQSQNLNSQNPKPSNKNFSHVVKCFEISILSFPFLFRISSFEFVILLMLGVLCVENFEISLTSDYPRSILSFIRSSWVRILPS